MMVQHHHPTSSHQYRHDRPINVGHQGQGRHVHNSRHHAPSSVRLGDSESSSIFSAQMTRSSKARTAPNPDSATLIQRISEADSTMPQAACGTPASDRHALLEVGLADGLGPDRIAESSMDGINLGSIDQSPAADQEPRDDQIQSILQSVLSRYPDGAGGTNSYSRDLLEDVVKTTLKSIESSTRKPNSMAVATPHSAEPTGIPRENVSEGKSCQSCGKKTNRQSELNKHMRRHTKPYGCTFDDCYKRCGSKNDLKRHEHSQHEQPECWRCEEQLNGSGPCYKLYHQREKYVSHLRDEHRMPNQDITKSLKNQKISRMNQKNYWCGFCKQIRTMERKGIPGDNERFDHIVDHFIKEGRDIDDWLPPEGFKTKGEIKGEIKAEKGEGKEKNASESRVNLGNKDDGDCEEDEEDDADEGVDGPDSESSESSQPRSMPSPTQMEQQQHHQQCRQQRPSSPPPTVKKRKASPASIDSSSVCNETSLGKTSAGDCHVKQKRRAKLASCCQCQLRSLIFAPSQVLANSKKCADCEHIFCKGCVYR
jgi:hypothetical protein